VFERKTGKELARLTQEDAVSSVAFSRDGHLLGLASGKTVLVTPWVPEDLVKYACAHLNSNLDPDEWKQYLLEERYRRTCPDLANGVRGLIRLKPPVVMPPTNLSVTVR
jgi:hypothetical protein